ncbi:uncharacterized protein J8A68_006165 [[Candida] subhashii]|uniref:Mitochondrial fusion and transport protein UGO1 n=1 Tax=[Candida] subhashii TaxID=561895 RepID=A0A8J5QCK8_9ASCO|nr:uncharacterized protein J8A68_006165 [[Candida] subhashii]KAG7660328.1 hypothetical protein J8A68_006165 [[Candida] subhashii]
MSNLDTRQLRPYYDHDTFNAGYSVIFKKDVGLIDMSTNKPITANLSSSNIDKVINNSGLLISKSSSFGRGGTGTTGGIGINARHISTGATSTTGGSGDKNYIYDLEFNEYFDLHNLTELIKNLLWNFIKNYMKVVLSQPLEIVRLVLQVGKFDFIEKPSQQVKPDLSKRLLSENNINGSTNDIIALSPTISTDEEEEINYFQPNLEQQVWSTQNSMHQDATATTPTPTSTTETATPQPVQEAPIARKSPSTNSIRKKSRSNKITPKSIHTIDILTSIVNKDGPFALFRGINASFIYQTLSRTIEAWITGFVSPFLGVPDPFFLDLTHSNDPFKSLWLSVSACVLTGLVLMPLDLIRVKLMLTQFTTTTPEESENNNRSVRESIRNFPIYYLTHPPWPIVCLTVLHQFSTSIFRKAAPYILLIKFNIDSYSRPNIFTFVNLISLIMEFFIKLPLENLLRKSQLGFLLLDKSQDEMKVITVLNPEENLIVEYNSGEMSDEDVNAMSLWQRVKSLGLFNGWRVGVLNVIGFWGYNILKSDGAELKEEKL